MMERNKEHVIGKKLVIFCVLAFITMLSPQIALAFPGSVEVTVECGSDVTSGTYIYDPAGYNGDRVYRREGQSSMIVYFYLGTDWYIGVDSVSNEWHNNSGGQVIEDPSVEAINYDPDLTYNAECDGYFAQIVNGAEYGSIDLSSIVQGLEDLSYAQTRYKDWILVESIKIFLLAFVPLGIMYGRFIKPQS